jgi:hypothetical protein
MKSGLILNKSDTEFKSEKMTAVDIFYQEPVHIGQNQKLKTPKTFFENVVNLKYLGMTATHQNFIHEDIKSRLSKVRCDTM